MTRVLLWASILGLLLGILGLLGGCGDSNQVRPLPTRRIVIEPNGMTLGLAESCQFTAKVYEGNSLMPGATVRWKTNGAIGTIDPATGLFLPHAAGQCQVTASRDDAADCSVSVTVLDAPAAIIRIKIFPPDGVDLTQIALGTTCNFTAVGYDNAGQHYDISPTWSTTGVCGGIDGNGKFTALALGSGALRAAYRGLQDDIDVTVVRESDPDPQGELTINFPAGVDKDALHIGDTVPLTVDGTTLPVTWALKEKKNTINTTTGLLALNALGTDTVYVTDGTRAGEATMTVVTTPIPPDPNPQLKILSPAGVDLQQLFINDTVYFGVANAQGPVTWSVTGTAGKVTQQGAFTATALGNATVHATDGVNSDSVAVTVVVIPPLANHNGRIAFVRRQTLSANLALLQPDGTYTPLTNGRQYFFDPKWAPGGDKILFTAQGSALAGLCTINENGSGAQRIAQCIPIDPVWSPDANTIIYVNGMAGTSELVKLSSATGDFIAKLTVGLPGVLLSPVWSPNGAYIVFAVTQSAGNGNGIYRMDADGKNMVQLASCAATAVAWNAATDSLLFTTEHEMYRLSPAGGTPELVYRESGVITGNISWTANGQWLIYGAKAGTFAQIKMVNPQTGRATTLVTFTDAHAVDPAWVSSL